MGIFQNGIDLIKSSVWFFLNLYLRKWIPHGFNLFVDLQNKIPSLKIRTIFDVGSNIGQSARRYSRHFPSAHIYCFEPVKSTFALLQRNTRDLINIQIHHSAMGAVRENILIKLQELSLVNSLLDKVDSGVDVGVAIEEVEVDTLDDYCIRHNIAGIDFLKIDTEGFDLNVLLGAENLLNGKHVSVVQVEAGVNPINDLHVKLEVLKKHLESKGFFLFGIYDQTPAWSGEPLMSFCNAVFVSSGVIKAYHPENV